MTDVRKPLAATRHGSAAGSSSRSSVVWRAEDVNNYHVVRANALFGPPPKPRLSCPPRPEQRRPPPTPVTMPVMHIRNMLVHMAHRGVLMEVGVWLS